MDYILVYKLYCIEVIPVKKFGAYSLRRIAGTTFKNVDVCKNKKIITAKFMCCTDWFSKQRPVILGRDGAVQRMAIFSSLHKQPFNRSDLG